MLGGVLLCATIIRIAFGVQSIKMAGLALAPFGKEQQRWAQADQQAAAARSEPPPATAAPNANSAGDMSQKLDLIRQL